MRTLGDLAGTAPFTWADYRRVNAGAGAHVEYGTRRRREGRGRCCRLQGEIEVVVGQVDGTCLVE